MILCVGIEMPLILSSVASLSVSSGTVSPVSPDRFMKAKGGYLVFVRINDVSDMLVKVKVKPKITLCYEDDLV